MDQPIAIEKTFRTLNTSATIPADGFLNLSAKVTWIEGPRLVRAVAVADPLILERPLLRCEVDLDDEWMTVIVHGPGDVPARATVVVKMKREVAVLLQTPEISAPQVEERALSLPRKTFVIP